MRQWDYPDRERGAADHDQPYTFGRTPLSYLHVREYARLLVKFPRREPEQLADEQVPS